MGRTLIKLQQDLMLLCQWNQSQNVTKLLEENPGVLDTTYNDGIYIRLAISNKSPKMLEDLLRYFKASLPQDQRSCEYSATMHRIFTIFEEYIDFEDLSSEIKMVLHKYLPEVTEHGLIDAAARGDIQLVKELYLYYPNSTQDILTAATSHEQNTVIDTLANMVATDKKKAIIFCDAADLYNKCGKLEQSHEFYEKAIKTCPGYYISHLHYANSIVSHLCNTDYFVSEAAENAESYYTQVIKCNPGYSCAHKKLGILYQIWSQNDSERKQELEIKVLESYVKAIECKIPTLKYDTLYTEITHLALNNIHHPKVQEIITDSSISDQKLRNEFSSIATEIATSDTASHTSEDVSVSSLSEEDLEYEEWYMDHDLDPEANASTIIGQTDQLFDTV